MAWKGRYRSALLISSALITANWVSCTQAEESIRPRLTAAQCQPLTDANYARCCIAINRRSILSSDQIEQCPPITTSLIATTLARSGDNNGPGGGDDPSGGGDPGGKGGDNGGKTGDDGGKTGDNGGKSGDDGGKSGDNGGKSGDNGGKSGDNGGRGGDSGGGSGN
ncbi:hypothetical protein EN935_02730 [Mesorhizobium sp. M7D.F.Ca.US.004.03.1.1]|nr:hypothetical protein EN993_22950 [Mesorhizobium sp. M7D.F.Ca.US.004.01.2.1]RVA36173.1 hypothetical protein EN935_02730 [Mesorhizobium sp. M7D.F.Ca.US.004.03.1.1]